MANRALLIGINDYQESPLRGCINDVVDFANLLVERAGFARNEVSLLTDGRATRSAILEHLRDLVRSVRPGDRALLHFSGHGVQLPSAEGSGEEDGLDEAICPSDYSWDDLGSFVRDKDFRRELANLPGDVAFVWVSDSCHSGTLTRVARPGSQEHHARTLTPPPDLAWRLDTLRSRRAKSQRGMRAAVDELPLAFIAGCQADKTADDAVFDGRPNGALTYHLLRELEKPEGMSVVLTTMVARVTQALQASGFEQRPALEGDQAQLQRGFLAPSPSAPSVAAPWLGLFAEIDRRAASDADFRRELMKTTTNVSRELAAAIKVDVGGNTGVIDDASPRARGGTVVRAFWWGFHIEISHQDLLSFLNVASPINSIVAAIGPVTGPAAPFVALIAAFIAGALGLLRGLDRGRGVYVSMSWFAPGIFVPTSV
jgi:metacaspase-1